AQGHDCHRRFHFVDHGGDQGRGNGPAATRQRFILHAALVRADADRASVHHLDKIHVGASRLEGLVIADLVTDSDYLGRGYVMDEIDEVWDSVLTAWPSKVITMELR